MFAELFTPEQIAILSQIIFQQTMIGWLQQKVLN